MSSLGTQALIRIGRLVSPHYAKPFWLSDMCQANQERQRTIASRPSIIAHGKNSNKHLCDTRYL
jgi:hypothetical protein